MNQDDDDEFLHAQHALGLDGTVFFKSDIGRLVLGRSKQERNDALAILTDMDSTPEEMREARTKANIAAKAVDWINEVIQCGKDAESQLLARDNDEGQSRVTL